MKKLLLLLTIVTLNGQCAHAVGVNPSKYFDNGAIYSGSSFPVDTAKCAAEEEIPPLEDLKIGESSTNNILGIIETGDGSIHTAAKNGGISKIYYVDHKINKVYVPFGFIPVYVKQIKTIVYGE